MFAILALGLVETSNFLLHESLVSLSRLFSSPYSGIFAKVSFIYAFEYCSHYSHLLLILLTFKVMSLRVDMSVQRDPPRHGGTLVWSTV
jgi:hypothetical protein